MESLDVKELVIYEDAPDGPRVTGVREFFVAKALLEEHKEYLSELVPSQWGLIHIFDLCLWFGHHDTAWALCRLGVDGCSVPTYYDLGPYAAEPECECDEGEDDVCWLCKYREKPCHCLGNETCQYCSWGWPVEDGIWMKDWDVPLDLTAQAAAQAAQKPLLCELLKIAGEGKELPLALPAEGMARLLDIAILTGDREAAAHISKKSQVWPLRRWRGKDFVDYYKDHLLLDFAFDRAYEHILLAALWAGADFQSIRVLLPDGTISLQAGIFLYFLFLSADWKRFAEGCPQLFKPPAWGEWGPTSTVNNLGLFFHCGYQLSVDRIQDAPKAGIDIRKVRTKCFDGPCYFPISLLGLAILFGQQDCAVACVRLGLQQSGVELHGHVNSELRDYLHSEAFSDNPFRDYHPLSNMDPPPSAFWCRSAAVAAGQAALRASWQREAAQKGVAVFQVMRKMLRSRSLPLDLVRDILAFSMEVPEFVEKLDLWNFVDGWMTLAPPNLDSHMEEVHGINESNDPRVREHETGTGSASATAAPTAPEPMEVDGKSTDELMAALRASRDQVPALNMDGVCVFRLTRMATSSHINDLFFDATGPLATLHARVLDAGCEVNPEWNPVKALFVPVTEEQREELRALAHQGYELNKDDHILALQEDQDVIAAALKEHLRFKNRPKIKKVGPPSTVDPEEEVEELGALLEVVCGIRTDSDVGMPSYQPH